MFRLALKRGLVISTALLGLEAAYAVLRPSPEQPQFDPSGVFGDPELPEIRVAVLGDSSVTAPGVSGPEESWVSLVCSRLASDRSVTLCSLAVGGATAADLVATQMEEAIAFQPDLVLIAVGANDMLQGVSRKQFAQNLDHLAGTMTATGAIVVLSGVGELGSIPRLFPPLSNLISWRARQYDRVHWDIGARHDTIVIDQRSDDIEVWYRDRELWSADLFHVSAAGHARWADTVWRALEPVVLADGDRI